MPDQQQDSGLLAQILLKQGEMGIQLAVIAEKLEDVKDHENRIRALERFRWAAGGAVLVISGGAGYVGYILGHAVH